MFVRRCDLPFPCCQEIAEELSQHCEWAVVTLGENGCIAKRRGEEAIREPASSGLTVEDTTGAGDLFDAGFL